MTVLAVTRDLKVADFVRDEIAQILQFEMRDPRISGFVSVNDVRVSKDLSFADIYVSSMSAETDEEKAEIVAVLNKASGFFRSKLAGRHSMRTTPRPRFHYDEVVDRAPRLEALIATAIAGDSNSESSAEPDDGELSDG